MPPTEAATGQRGEERGGGEMKHAGSQRRWRWIKRRREEERTRCREIMMEE